MIEFTERSFLPFTDSNQLHVIHDSFVHGESGYNVSTPIQTCLINVHGRLLFVEQEKSFNLQTYLNEIPNDHSLELICADISGENKNGCLALLATFWVELSEHCIPHRYFGAIFRVSNKFEIELGCKVTTTATVAYCRLTDRKVYTENQHCWIIFKSGDDVCAYIIEGDSGEAKAIDDVFSVFPELSLSVLPGAATRSACTESSFLRWSALGFDTGHAILSVSTIGTHAILDRKTIKFSCPISVLMFIPSTVQSVDPRREEQYLVISSTLGPLAIWKCIMEDERLSWHSQVVLGKSQHFDSVTCASIHNGFIAVGTYSGRVLFYSDCCDVPVSDIISSMEVNAPIVSMKILDDYSLGVLSTAGLHTISRSDSSSSLFVT